MGQVVKSFIYKKGHSDLLGIVGNEIGYDDFKIDT